MGRSYAGILGSLCLAATLVRGAILGVPIETTLLRGWLALLIFAPLGGVFGWLAQEVVDGSVRQIIDEELQAQRASRTAATGTPG